MVDYALRRRFAFRDLEPAFSEGLPKRFAAFLVERRGVPSELVERINRNMYAVNKVISADRDLGPGYVIGHSFFVPTDLTSTST